MRTSRLPSFRDVVRDQVQALFAEPAPPLVYHYTSWAGVKGILEHSTFYAKHYRDMDDQQEFQHADAAIRQAAVRLLRRVWPKPALSVLQPFIRSYSNNRLPARSDFDVYVACFCVAADQEYLWRTQYGRNCEGYCLGIRMLAEPHALVGNPHVNGGVVRVVYEPEHIQAIVTREWQELLNALSKRPDGDHHTCRER